MNKYKKLSIVILSLFYQEQLYSSTLDNEEDWKGGPPKQPLTGHKVVIYDKNSRIETDEQGIPYINKSELQGDSKLQDSSSAILVSDDKEGLIYKLSSNIKHQLYILSNGNTEYQLIDGNNEKRYLAINKIAKDNFDYAYFFSQESVSNTSSASKFRLLRASDNTYRIQCNFGERSYLAISKIIKGSFDYAYFGTPQYIHRKILSPKLNFLPVQHGHYRLEYEFGEKSYLSLYSYRSILGNITPYAIFNTDLSAALAIRFSSSSNTNITDYKGEDAYQPIENCRSTNRISLESFRGKLFMAYTEQNAYGAALAYSQDGRKWLTTNVQSNKQIKYIMSLKAFKDKLYMVGKSRENDEKIFLSSSSDGIQWENIYQFHDHQISNIYKSTNSVSLESFKDKLYMAYTRDSVIQVSYSSNGKDFETYKPFSPKNLTEPWLTKNDINLKAFKDKLYMAHKDYENGEEIWLSTSENGKDWKDVEKFGNLWKSTNSVSLESFEDKIYMAYMDKSDKISLLYSQDGKIWAHAYRYVDGKLTTKAVSLTTFNKNQLYLGYRDNKDNKIWLNVMVQEID